MRSDPLSLLLKGALTFASPVGRSVGLSLEPCVAQPAVDSGAATTNSTAAYERIAIEAPATNEAVRHWMGGYVEAIMKSIDDNFAFNPIARFLSP